MKTIKHIKKIYDKNRNAFAVPDGAYPARLRSVTSSPSKKYLDGEDTRFLFDIMNADGSEVDYMARKVFPDTSEGQTELDNALLAFCSEDELQAMLDSGGIALDGFVGQNVDLIIKTKTVKGYQYPYSEICGIYPRGSCCPLTEADAA